MSKFIKYGSIIILSLLISGTAYLHFAPVDFDAAICTGGYSRWITDKNTEELIETFLSEQGYDKKAKYNLVSKPEEIVSTVDWKGRNIKVMLTIEIDNKVYDVHFTGKRYWIEKYDWEVSEVI